MARPFVIGLLAFVLVAGAGFAWLYVNRPSEKSYLDVYSEQRLAWQELTDILTDVRDEKSMADAKAKLDDRLARFETIAAKARAMPLPSNEIRTRLDRESAAMQRDANRLTDEVGRVRRMPGGEFLKQFDTKSPVLFSYVPQ